MGIQGLRKFLKTNAPQSIADMEISEALAGMRVGIDTSIYA